MPTSLDSLRNRLTSALADRKISVSEADALVKQAQADGLAPEEATFLEDTVARNRDAFDSGAAEVMTKAISLDGAPTRRELADPAVLNKHTGSVSYSWVPGNLFVDGVKETDVIQGQIANCYMVSSFAAIAHTHPDAIQNAIKDNGDGTFTVRFFLRFGIMSWSISVKFSTPSGAPCGTSMSNIAGPCWVTSTSTSRSSSCPSTRSCLSFSRVRR